MEDNLAHHVQSLPAELSNEIRNLVFTSNPETHVITADYKPPTKLAVDAATRAIFAESYYGAGNIFVFHDEEVMLKWIDSLEASYRSMIKSIQCITDYGIWNLTPPYERSTVEREIEEMKAKANLKRSFLQLIQSVEDAVDRLGRAQERLIRRKAD